MNNEKKSQNRKFPGFYIALCCCVLAIGAVGYLNERRQTEKTSSVAENIEDSLPTALPEIPITTVPPSGISSAFNISTAPPLTEKPSVPAPAETAAAEQTAAEDFTLDNPDLAQSVSKAEETALPVFELPAEGEILASYCGELSYNQALGDWRTHNGIDIAANEGASIRCSADGEVKSVTETVFGCEIVVSHSGGYETLYSQISANDGLEAGSNVRRGDVIGTVRAPAGENIAEPHLHFEVHQNGECVDPTSLM